MSNQALANINHTTWFLTATTTPQSQDMGEWAEKCVIQNSGTVPVYVRAATSATITMTLPTFTAMSQGCSEILPGGSASFNWSTTIGGPTNPSNRFLHFVSSANTTFSIKMSNGK